MVVILGYLICSVIYMNSQEHACLWFVWNFSFTEQQEWESKYMHGFGFPIMLFGKCMEGNNT